MLGAQIQLFSRVIPLHVLTYISNVRSIATKLSSKPKSLHVKRQTKLYECLENKYECDTAQVRHTHTSTSGDALFAPAYS